jgi:hypothetical protein
VSNHANRTGGFPPIRTLFYVGFFTAIACFIAVAFVLFLLMIVPALATASAINEGAFIFVSTITIFIYLLVVTVTVPSTLIAYVIVTWNNDLKTSKILLSGFVVGGLVPISLFLGGTGIYNAFYHADGVPVPSVIGFLPVLGIVGVFGAFFGPVLAIYLTPSALKFDPRYAAYFRKVDL